MEPRPAKESGNLSWYKWERLCVPLAVQANWQGGVLISS